MYIFSFRKISKIYFFNTALNRVVKKTPFFENFFEFFYESFFSHARIFFFIKNFPFFQKNLWFLIIYFISLLYTINAVNILSYFTHPKNVFKCPKIGFSKNINATFFNQKLQKLHKSCNFLRHLKIFFINI